ncbi:MAG TPA: hypothetical protein VD907_07130 [Verrucomicrobiae bacterium]|nr:hypothetical protein [Verrucomicrobiae bacterium]
MIVTTYHAFTDCRDDWFDTEAEAKQAIKQWRSEGYTNLRIYQEQSDDQLDDLVDETCIFSEGDFPY